MRDDPRQHDQDGEPRQHDEPQEAAAAPAALPAITPADTPATTPAQAGAPLRVLQVLGTSAGGVVRHVAEVVGLLEADGVEVRVAGPSSVRGNLDPDARFERVEIAARPGLGDARAVAALRRVVAGADVVHAHGLRAGAFAVLAARLRPRRPRVVVTLHNLPVGGRAVRTVSAVLERVVARGADAVLGVSGDLVARAQALGARDTARALVPAPPARLAARDTSDVRQELGLDERPFVLTVARLAPQKGLDTLLDAAAVLARSHPRARWVVAGDGPLRTPSQDEAARRDLPVTFLGARADVPDLLHAADVVVSTAVWEGQPIAVQEALRAGAALVATDAGGTCEVTGTDAVVLVPVGDAAAVAAAVAGLLDDPVRRASLQGAARRRAAELPGPADVLAQLLATYRRGAPL